MNRELENKLKAPFHPDKVKHRMQGGKKLSYLDARDVQDRLDEVFGIDGWQQRYEFHGPRTMCYLSVKIGDAWITKADGADDSNIEAAKGGLSDAFKRAAVQFGVGRYLYSGVDPTIAWTRYIQTKRI